MTSDVRLFIKRTDECRMGDADALASLIPSRREKVETKKIPSAWKQELAAGLLIRDVLGVTSDDDLYYTDKGKPYLRRQEEPKRFFSVSHCADMAVLAEAEFEVGADAETIRELKESLITRVFTSEEREVIIKDQDINSIILWTRLEAALKESGQGLAGLYQRDYSLIGNKGPIYFHTIMLDQTIISAAARQPFELVTAGEPFICLDDRAG